MELDELPKGFTEAAQIPDNKRMIGESAVEFGAHVETIRYYADGIMTRLIRPRKDPK